MTDFRIKTSWRTSRKRKRLIRRLGCEGVIALQDLWSYCADERTSGDLSGLSNEDIADECDWLGEPDQFVAVLVDLELLDGEPGAYRIHDWEEHNPWVAGAEQRSKQASEAARARWDKRKRDVMPDHAGSIAPSTDQQCPNTNTNTNTVSNTTTEAAPIAGGGVSAAPGEGVVSMPELQALIEDKGWRKARRKWLGRGEILAPFTHGQVARAMAEAAAEFKKSGSRPNGGLVIRILERIKEEGDADPPLRHPASTPASEINTDEEPTWELPEGGVMTLLQSMADGMALPQ